MADVFVSYVSEDRAIAEKISRGLEAAGLSVWWDRHIHGGVGFRKEIDRQLGDAKVVVVLWSTTSLDSEWVCDEAEQARDENKLIPVRLDGAQPPLGFRQTQSLDFRGWNGDPNASTFASLVNSARHFLGRPPVVAPIEIPPTTAAKRGRWRASKAQLLTAATILALVAGAVAIVLRLDHGLMPTTGDSNGGRIEIGTFELQTQGDDIARFTNGLTDAIRRVFAANEIKTVAPTEHTAASGDHAAPSAEFLLRGTIDRDEGRFVVTADILHRREGLVLWSATLRQDIEDIPQFQEKVSISVARVLDCALRLRVLADGDPSADLFTKFIGYCDAHDAEQLPELARRIVETAPQYGISHALLAMASAYLTSIYPQSAPRSDAELTRLQTIANDNAKIAMQLDPKRLAPLVDWVSAIIDERGPAERENLLQRSLSADSAFPGMRLWWYASFLEGVGRIDEARSYYRRAGREFPLESYEWSPVMRSTELAAIYDIDGARRDFADLGRTLPTDWERFWVEFWYGDPVVAKQLIQDQRYARLIQPSQRVCVDAVLDAKSRRVQLSVEQIDAACASPYFPLHWLEDFYADFGHVDEAYRQMEINVASYYTRWAAPNLYMPFTRSVRADPRFMPFVAHIGLVDYWLDSGHWPDFCTREKLPYDCKEAALAARASAVE